MTPGTGETTVTVTQMPTVAAPTNPPPYNQIFNNQPGYPPPGGAYPHPQPYPQPGYPGYPPPQGQQQFHQPQSGQVIITNPIVVQPGRTVIVTPNVGPSPTMTKCPSCQLNVVTKVDHEISGMTHCWAITLCLIGCWPFVCIPYCCSACQNANHYCPQCGNYIGSYGMC